MRRLLLWAPLAFFALVVAVVALGMFRPADRTIHSRLVGQPVPQIALPPLLPGRAGVDSGRLAGNGPRLLNVFGSWCVPCIAEAPQLMRLKAAGARIDAIAVRDTPEAVRGFLARHGDPYAAIGDDKASRALLALGSSGVPETFVVDGRGIIVAQHIGDIREDDVPRLLAALEQAR